MQRNEIKWNENLQLLFLKLAEQVFHVTRDNEFIFVSFSFQFSNAFAFDYDYCVGHAIICHYTLLIQQAKRPQLHQQRTLRF